jgi:hypothetical protein
MGFVATALFVEWDGMEAGRDEKRNVGGFVDLERFGK